MREALIEHINRMLDPGQAWRAKSAEYLENVVTYRRYL